MFLPLLLTHSGMDSNAREIALAEQLVKLSCTIGALYEDDDLVEFEGVEKLVQLSIFLCLTKLDVELLEAM